MWLKQNDCLFYSEVLFMCKNNEPLPAVPKGILNTFHGSFAFYLFVGKRECLEVLVEPNWE